MLLLYFSFLKRHFPIMCSGSQGISQNGCVLASATSTATQKELHIKQDLKRLSSIEKPDNKREEQGDISCNVYGSVQVLILFVYKLGDTMCNLLFEDN